MLGEREFVVDDVVFRVGRIGRSLWVALLGNQHVASAGSLRALGRELRNRVEGNPPWAPIDRSSVAEVLR
jgi:hypothetical protein